MPRLMSEDGVGRDGDDFCVMLLELRVELRELLQLGRTDEGEVGWIKDEHRPLAAELGETHRLNLLFVIRLKLKVGHRLAHLHLRGVVAHRVVEFAAVLTVVALHFFHSCR